MQETDEKIKEKLIDFEKRIGQGKIPYLIHLSGGNEDQLIEIFKEIEEGDYIFSTHRSHYHYLLAGGSEEELEKKILEGNSMFVFDKKLNFLSSSIVAGTPSIAAGVAWALKRKGNKNKVWCFVGDGAEDEGNFCEAVRYVDGWDLPCIFVIEDNDRSVNTPKKERYGKGKINWPECVRRYIYTPTYPHAGTGKQIKNFKPAKIEQEATKDLESIENNDLINLTQKIIYKDALKQTMETLAQDPRTIFVGYNIKYGSASGTLKDVPEDKRLETPLAENLMTGLAMGMSLEGYKPILFFERQDFILCAMDAIINHLDKIKRLSKGQYQFPVIIRAVVGAKKPIYPGITHTQDFTKVFRELLSFPVYEPKTSSDVLSSYKKAFSSNSPSMIVEKVELYGES